MNTSRSLIAISFAALALSLTACAGEPRPTADEVADGIYEIFEEQGQSDVITEDVSQCLAEKLVDSDVSDETLQYIADGKDQQKDEDDKELVTKILTSAETECIPAE